MPGFYHVYAAALGSTPTDVQFEITFPKRGVVTKTAKPKPTKKATQKTTQKTTASAKPSAQATPTTKPTKKGGGSVCGGDNAAGTC